MKVESRVRGVSWFSASLIGVLAWVVPGLMSLVITPQIVLGLGPENYGLLSILLGFIGYSFNLNLSRAVTRNVAEALGSGDSEGIGKVVGTGLVFVTTLSILTISTSYFLATVIIEFAWGSADRLVEVEYGLVASVATIVALLYGQIFTAILLGYQRLGLAGLITILSSASNLGVSVLLVWYGYGFVAVSFGIAAVAWMSTALSAIVALRLVGPEFNLHYSSVHARSIASFSKYVIGYQILGNILVIYERIAVTHKLGPTALAFYVVPMVVGLQFIAFINGFISFIFPSISANTTVESYVVKLYRVATAAVFPICGMALIAAWIHGELFLELWIGRDFARGAADAFRFQMVGLVSVAMASVVFQVAEGLGRPQLNLWAGMLVSGVTMVLFSIPQLDADLTGFAIARAVGFGLWLPLILILEFRLFGSIQTQMWYSILRCCGPTLLVFGGVQLTLPHLFDDGWLSLLVSLAFGIILGVVILSTTDLASELIRVVRHGDQITNETGG